MLAKNKKPARKKPKTAKNVVAAPLATAADAQPLPLAAPAAPSLPSIDSSLSPKERADAVLRRAGLSRSDNALPQSSPQDTSPLASIPEKGQVLLERFFGGGAILFGGIFIAAGIGVSIEALCKVTGNQLPVVLDEVLVQYVEPVLTPSILILFFFSISLGLLKQLQMTAGTAGVLYTEDDD